MGLVGMMSPDLGVSRDSCRVTGPGGKGRFRLLARSNHLLYATTGWALCALLTAGCSPLTQTAHSSPSSTTSPYDLERLNRWLGAGGMRSIERAFDATVYAEDLFDALLAGDAQRIDAKCRKMTDPFTLQLDRLLPSPDAELTIALAAVVDAATDLQQACNAAARSPRDDDKALAVSEAVDAWADELTPLEEVFGRLGQELSAAGY